MGIERHPKMLEQLRRHEGLRLAPYRCPAGFLTVGYGHNLDADPVPGMERRSALTEGEAEALLQRDTDACGRALDAAFPVWRSLGEARQAVLLNMAFNLGVQGLLRFTRTLEAVKRGDFETAAREMLDSKWRRDVKGRALELAEQMRSGCWQSVPQSGKG